MYEKMSLSELFTQQSLISAAIAKQFISQPTCAEPLVGETSETPDTSVADGSGTSGGAVNTVPEVPVVPTPPATTSTELPTLPNGKKSKPQPLNADGTPELDGEGFPWDYRIHSQAQGKVQSKLVKDAECWRLIKGLNNPELVAQVRAEYKPALNDKPVTTETYVAPAVAAVPTPPAAPSAPVAPVAPVVAAVPTPPAAPADVVVPSPTALIKSINSLIQDLGVDGDDIVTLLQAEFGVDGIDGVKPEQIPDVEKAINVLVEKYTKLHDMSTEILQWGGDTYEQNVKDGLASIYSKYHCETLGNIHHSDLDAAIEDMTSYRQSWLDAGFGA